MSARCGTGHVIVPAVVEELARHLDADVTT